MTQTREERINAVLALWNQRVEWWNGEYKYAEGFHIRAQPAEKRGQSRRQRSDPLARRAAGGATVDVDSHRWPSGTSERRTRSRGRRRLRRPPRIAALATEPIGRRPHPRIRTSQPTPPLRATRVGPRYADALLERQRSHAGVRTCQRSVVGDHGVPGSIGGEAAAKKDESGKEATGPAIAIKPWDPSVPYLVAMREAGGDGAYAVYLKQRKNFAASPAFYLDCADYLLKNGQKQMGIRVLTNIAELKLDNAQILRIVAHKLNQIGDRDLAINLFEKVKTMRPEEPQSFRDLALALAERAEASMKMTSTASADSTAHGAISSGRSNCSTPWS